MKRDHYETLGVARDADGETIKKAFRKRAKETHPDKGGSKEQFLEVRRAFKTLGDDEARAHYDETGRDAEDRGEENQAEAMLCGMMLQTIAEAPCVDGLDLVRLCAENIQLMDMQIEIELRNLPERVAKVKEAHDRLRNPSDSFLRDGLKSAAVGLEASIETLRRRQELAKEMKRLLEPFKYDFDERKKPEGYEGPLAGFILGALRGMRERREERGHDHGRRGDEDPRRRPEPGSWEHHKEMQREMREREAEYERRRRERPNFGPPPGFGKGFW